MEYTIDAQGKRLGRLASDIASTLQGKKRADYDPKNIGRDRVLVKNAAQVTVSGRKFTRKVYHRHTGYMGHLKTLTYQQAFEKNPKEVIREAVRKMLPRNFLNQRRIKNLRFVD